MLSTCGIDLSSNPCENCFEEKPSVGLLSVYVSYNSEHQAIPIRILKGKLESGSVYIQDTLREPLVEYWVEVGSFYTVEATYKLGEKTILAVDGDRVSVYLDDSSCDAACWRPNDGRVNCELN